jgi:hypothetical protein
MSARRTRRAPVAVLACVVAVVVSLVACVAALGSLYLLRDSPALHAGPAVSGALPLQRLAHQDTQPLLRFVLAWAPAGLAAGLALAWLTHLRAATRAAVAGAIAFVVLFASGALSDAVTASEPVSLHVASQLGHAAPWLAAAITAGVAALAGVVDER